MEDNSFIAGVVSLALDAQSKQEVYVEDPSAVSSISSITEKDGYVGEMVKASLALFESKPKDLTAPFGPEYTMILDKVEDAQTGEIFSVQESFNSVAELISLLGEDIDADIWMNSEGKVVISGNKILHIDAYQSVDPNFILCLPRR